MTPQIWRNCARRVLAAKELDMCSRAPTNRLLDSDETRCVIGLDPALRFEVNSSIAGLKKNGASFGFWSLAAEEEAFAGLSVCERACPRQARQHMRGPARAFPSDWARQPDVLSG